MLGIATETIVKGITLQNTAWKKITTQTEMEKNC